MYREEGMQRGLEEGREIGREIGHAEGFAEGREEGIRALIATCRKFSLSEEDIVVELTNKFSIDIEKAK